MDKITWRDRMAAALKAYRLGSASISIADASIGVQPSMFAPEEYGEYIAKSVSVYACVKLRADLLSSVPLMLYRQKGSDREAVTGGSLHELLRAVNPHWTFAQLIRMTEYSLSLHGSAYWVIERGVNGKGEPKEIWWARPDKMIVVPDQQNYLGGFIYEQQGQRIKLAPSEVIWFRQANPMNEFAGLSPLAAARLSVELGMSGLKSNKALFDQGMHLGGVISPAGGAPSFGKDQATALEKLIDTKFRGQGKFHRWLIASGGELKVQPMGINPKDAEFVEQMKWSLADVCRVYQVPPVLVQDLENSTYSNFEQALRALWSLCIQPQARMIAGQLNEQLLPMFGNQADRCEFDFSGVDALQEAEDSRWAREQGQITTGAITINEWRASRGYDPVPWGDAPNGATGEAITQAPETGTADDTQEAGKSSDRRRRTKRHAVKIAYGDDEHRTLMNRFEKRVGKRERDFRTMLVEYFEEQERDVLAELAKGGKIAPTGTGANRFPDTQTRDPFSPSERLRWIEELRRRATPLLSEAVDDAGEATLSELSVSASFNLQNPRTQAAIRQQAQTFAAQVNEATYTALKASLAAGEELGESIDDLAGRVRHVMGIAQRSRSETIARTEIIRATNFGAVEGARQSGVVAQKKWLSTLDDRTRDWHLEAMDQTVNLDEPFSVDGEALDYPGDSAGSAENTINCRCTLTWVVNAEGRNEVQSGAIAQIQKWLMQPQGARGTNGHAHIH